MTIFYLDTEFNGHCGELISIALVSPCGEWFYAGVRPNEIELNSWVKENVMPKLGNALMFNTYSELQDELQKLLCDFDNPEIICDWHADAIHFLNLLEGPDYAGSLDYACRITILKTPSFNGPVSKNPHNAVADATALMEWHQNEPARILAKVRETVAQTSAHPPREVQD